jgi:hypothetical protein
MLRSSIVDANQQGFETFRQIPGSATLGYGPQSGSASRTGLTNKSLQKPSIK